MAMAKSIWPLWESRVEQEKNDNPFNNFTNLNFSSDLSSSRLPGLILVQDSAAAVTIAQFDKMHSVNFSFKKGHVPRKMQFENKQGGSNLP